jgi:hypothetical protein
MSVDSRSRFISAIQKNPAMYVFTTTFMGFTAGLDIANARHATSFWNRYGFVSFLLFALLLSYRLTQTIIEMRDGRDPIGK